MNHQISTLMSLFDSTFYETHNTRLVCGDDEPVYLPACQQFSFHRIVFAHGYFTSALHEVAHWCVAGTARRQLEDYGYWYLPDGRNEEQQQAFEQVEVKPQAIEWAFCVASNHKFNVSADNLNGHPADTAAFKLKVYKQVLDFLENGFPKRAQHFITALAEHYQQPMPLLAERFTLDRELYEEV